MFALTITTDTGATVTIQKGTETPQSQVATNGTVTFEGLEAGTWHAVSSLNGVSSEQDIEIKDSYTVEMPINAIYGIQRDITNPSSAWERTDNAVGLSATATIGTITGHSDFDNRLPWSGMQRETLSTGDVMVKIPKFYYQRLRSGNIETIKISPTAQIGFDLYPAFNMEGVQQEYVYIGAYESCLEGTSLFSKTGQTPQANTNRAQFRTYARNKGAGWNLWSMMLLNAVQMLYLVEYADNNSQAKIGRGVDNGTLLQTGGADTVSGLTGCVANNGQGAVVYRGIENIWGNYLTFIDGIVYYIQRYYVSNTPSQFGDNFTGASYQLIGYYPTGNTMGYFTTTGYNDNDLDRAYMLPVSWSGSETTYYCDQGACDLSTKNQCACLTGGGIIEAGKDGIFYENFAVALSHADGNSSTRLMYIPTTFD